MAWSSLSIALALSLVFGLTVVKGDDGNWCQPNQGSSPFNVPWPGMYGIQQINQGITTANWSSTTPVARTQILGNTTFYSRAVAVDASNNVYVFDSERGILSVNPSGSLQLFLPILSGIATPNFVIDGEYLYSVVPIAPAESILYVVSLSTGKVASVSTPWTGEYPVLFVVGNGLVAYSSEALNVINVYSAKSLSLQFTCALTAQYTLNISLLGLSGPAAAPITTNGKLLFANVYNAATSANAVLAFSLVDGSLVWTFPYSQILEPFMNNHVNSAVSIMAAGNAVFVANVGGNQCPFLLDATSGLPRVAFYDGQALLGVPGGCDLLTASPLSISTLGASSNFFLSLMSAMTGDTKNLGFGGNLSSLQLQGSSVVLPSNVNVAIFDSIGYIITAVVAGNSQTSTLVEVSVVDPSAPSVVPPFYTTSISVPSLQPPLAINLLMGNSGNFIVCVVGLNGGNVYQFTASPWE